MITVTIALFIGAMLLWKQVVNVAVGAYGWIAVVVIVIGAYLIAVRIDRKERAQRPD